MIRLRRADGEVIELPEMAFVEICDVDGAVARLIYQDTEGGMHVIGKGDAEADGYKRLFPEVTFVDIVSL